MQDIIHLHDMNKRTHAVVNSNLIYIYVKSDNKCVLFMLAFTFKFSDTHFQGYRLKILAIGLLVMLFISFKLFNIFTNFT